MKNVTSQIPPKDEYPEEITKNALEYGFKDANLMFLKDIIAGFPSKKTPASDVHAAIPAIYL